VKAQPLVELVGGDVIMFPHGDAHVMCSGPEADGHMLSVEAVPRFPEGTEIGDPARPEVALVCGFLGCDREPFNPLCAALPRQLRVPGLSDGIVGIFAQKVHEESLAGRMGSESMLTRLAELMFVEVLRRYLEALPDERGGWLAGLRDPLVGRALAQLHARPGHRWTLPELARASASSRTILAERFAALVGVPPMQYLTQWRMQLAATRLRDTAAKVATVAGDVGYDSEAAFSRAFKKATGVAPGRWRARG
jgi:AraC-like DNA-binding protein